MYRWANGNQYDGEWQNDIINGHGCMFWADGKVYI